MEKYNYYHEIPDILKQFVSAFDNAVIKRTNENRQPQDIIRPRYLNAPKGRVLHDIISQEPHSLVLPLITFDISSIARDESRIFNKLTGYYPLKNINGKQTQKIPQPIPINIDIKMSIITKFEIDMYQIISNFVVYSNPYIIITWKTPNEAGLDYSEEIRTEVVWSGNIPVNKPSAIGASERYSITADTTFTIKTWLFRDLGEDTKNIYYINADFYEVSRIPETIFNYTISDLLSGGPYFGDTPGVSLSAAPQITNIYYTKQGLRYEVFETQTISQPSDNNTVLLLGKNFNITTTVGLSSNVENTFTILTQLSSERGQSVSLYPILTYDILSDNIMSINIPDNLTPGTYDIVLHNFVDWQSTGLNNNIYFILE